MASTVSESSRRAQPQSKDGANSSTLTQALSGDNSAPPKISGTSGSFTGTGCIEVDGSINSGYGSGNSSVNWSALDNHLECDGTIGSFKDQQIVVGENINSGAFQVTRSAETPTAVPFQATRSAETTTAVPLQATLLVDSEVPAKLGRSPACRWDAERRNEVIVKIILEGSALRRWRIRPSTWHKRHHANPCMSKEDL